MMKSIQKTSYQKLIVSLKQIVTKGLVDAQKELEYQRLKTYWTIGKEIIESVGRSEGEMTLGANLYKEISACLKKDLDWDISADTLFRAIQFSRDHPVFPQQTPLTFTHYIALHRVTDDRQRKDLEKKAIKEGLSALDLKKEIAFLHLQKSIGNPTCKKQLVVERGELYVYYLAPQTDIKGKRANFIDCGFKICLPMEGEVLKNQISTQTQQKRVVKAYKEEGHYQVKLHKKYAGNLYTYLARVLKIVDGDTMDVRIDVGFGIQVNERIRLKAINTPEVNTALGKSAKKFVEKYLSECPLIVVRTHKAGMYGRWLADVFALSKCSDSSQIAAEGEYLNQVLLDKGLAALY